MNRLFLIIAIVGFLVSLLIHILALFEINLLLNYPYLRVLHFVLFLLLFGIFLNLRKDQEFDFSEPLQTIKKIYKRTPRFIIIWIASLFIYNVIYNNLIRERLQFPFEENKKFYTEKFEEPKKEITKKQYEHILSNKTASDSNNWVFFYGISIVIFINRKRKTLPNNK